MDYWIKCAAKWQREFMAMKAERDNLAALLKMHHEAVSKLNGSTS